MAQERQVLGGLDDVAHSGRCLPGIYSPFCLTTDSVWGSNAATKILPQTPLQLCGHVTLCTPGSYKGKSPGYNFQKSYCFPDKKDNSTGTGFCLLPSPFLPAWVTEATPEGGVTLLQKGLKAATLWWGRRQEPGWGCLVREATLPWTAHLGASCHAGFRTC